MIQSANDLGDIEAFTADICVVGGGVAGIVLANELKGKVGKVIILESGGVDYDLKTQDLYTAEAFPADFPNPISSRLRMLGGASNHWENNTSPLDKEDFEVRSWVENSGWPISIKDLQPYYDRAGSYCGVEDDGYQKEFWLKKIGAVDIIKESKILDTGIAKASRPPVRFFYRYGQALVDHAGVHVITEANVVDVRFNARSQQIERVYFEDHAGYRRSVNARVYIMCMGGIENARMLLHFNENNNNLLGNKYDNVGRYFMEHPVARAAVFYPKNKQLYDFFRASELDGRGVLGFLRLTEQTMLKNSVNNIRMPLIPGDEYLLSDGISSYHSLADAIKQGEWPEDFGQHVINFLSDLDMVGEAVYRKKFGEKLFDSSDDFSGFQIAAMLEQTPQRSNRVYLGSKKDSFGIKKVNIQWEISESDKAQFWKALTLTANEVGALGLGKIRLFKEHSSRIWGDQLGFGHHHMGTTRMSDRYEDGVVDSNSKVYGSKNLYVAGSSVFTTGGHVPPTLTIVALSIRLAVHLEEVLGNEVS